MFKYFKCQFYFGPFWQMSILVIIFKNFTKLMKIKNNFRNEFIVFINKAMILFGGLLPISKINYSIYCHILSFSIIENNQKSVLRRKDFINNLFVTFFKNVHYKLCLLQKCRHKNNHLFVFYTF
jgi:hypothetical protein